MSSASEMHLSIRQLDVRYDTVQAVQEASLDVGRGEVIALLGSNGAGKTTTLRAITGLVTPNRGTITYEGNTNLVGTAAHRIAAMGIRMVPEGRHVFPLMSVRDNLLMGAFLANRAETNQTLEAVLAHFPRLKERLKQSAGTLSGGEQQMVAMGRALMGRPKLLLLDEPSLGLAPMMIREIAKAIREVNQTGTTVLLVEQNSQMALQLSDRAYVFETGRIALSGSSADLMNNDHIRRLYLGIQEGPL